MTLKAIKPNNPSKEEYLELSKEFNRKWLLYNRYRELLRYEEQDWSLPNNISEEAQKYEVLFNKRANNDKRKRQKKRQRNDRNI